MDQEKSKARTTDPHPTQYSRVTQEELARWESKIEKFHFASRDTILRLVTTVRALETEIKARGEAYGRMCETLHECCQRHKLGLGGEHVDQLVVEEVDRLRASLQAVGGV